jgi:plasmid stabilization system protein ParE
MIPQIRLRPEAEADLLAAFQWYEIHLKGLGDEFLQEVDRSLNLIQEQPQSYPVLHRDIRRALIRRFPYGVFYLVERETR